MIGIESVSKFDKADEALLWLHEGMPVTARVPDGEPVAGSEEQGGGGEAGVGLVHPLCGVRGLRALEEGLAAFDVGVGAVQDPGDDVMAVQVIDLLEMGNH